MSNEKTTPTVDPRKVITGKVLFSYLYAFEPKETDDGKKKYQVSLVISKDDTETLDKIRAAIEAAKLKGKEKQFGGKIPANLKLPLCDGDTDREDLPEYANSFFVNANSDKKPGIVDARRLPITDPEQLYSGCLGRASITFFPFNYEGKKGIGVALNNLQKLEDGERLGGSRASAEDDFSEGDDEFL
jgi:hypothetical protein